MENIEELLQIDNKQLVPSKIFKSELSLLSNEDFEKLRKHMGISDYQMSESDYDTIIIFNKIFKRAS
jgi:hypothetical protein